MSYEPTREEMAVMSALNNVKGLLEEIKASPEVYIRMFWDLNQISELASKFTQVLLDAENQAVTNADELTLNAKLKIAGWQ